MGMLVVRMNAISIWEAKERRSWVPGHSGLAITNNNKKHNKTKQRKKTNNTNCNKEPWEMLVCCEEVSNT